MSAWSTSTTKWAMVMGVATLTLALVAGAGWWVAGGEWWSARTFFDPQATLTLHTLMDGEHDGNNPTTNPREITDEACDADLVPCVEAFDTAEAVYYRFSTRQVATDFAKNLTDGFQSNYIVMNFEGKTTGTSKERQLWAMQYLAGAWQDYEGDFPAR